MSVRTGAAPRPGSDRSPLKLREQAYVAFTKRLLSRAIRPGQFVSQRELVERTGLPLGAIRELVPRLEAEGLIIAVPQRGLQVAHVDMNLIRNAFQFRLFLEREATAVFAASAPASEIGRLKARHQQVIRRARKGMDAALVAEAQATDQDLHETIIDHLRNDIISNAFRVNWIKIRLIRQAETRLYDEPVMQDHLRVIEALEARDAARAAAAMSEHIINARNRALAL